MNLETVTLPFSNLPCVVYDLSGQGRYRESWAYFYPDIDGIFFVVDTSDRARLSVVQEILLAMAKHPLLKGREIPFVIVANKQDHPDHVDEEDLRKIIQVDLLKSVSKMSFFVKNAIGKHGVGVSECFQMFEGRS